MPSSYAVSTLNSIALLLPFQPFQIVKLKSKPPSLIPIQAPIYLARDHTHCPQNSQPVQYLFLLPPSKCLRWLLPADLHPLDVGPGQPFANLLDALFDLLESRVGFYAYWSIGPFFGAEVDGEVNVSDARSEGRGED